MADSISKDILHIRKHIVQDDLVAVWLQRRLNGCVGVLDHLTPRGNAIGVGTAEILGRDGCNVLWIDVGDEDVRHA